MSFAVTSFPLAPLVGRRVHRMNGLGNDFAILDRRGAAAPIDAALARALGDRTRGPGCDQIIAIDRPAGAHGGAAAMRIWNSDGGEVEACGNAARCVAWLLMEETGADAVAIESPGGLLRARRVGDRRVAIDMGAPRFDWADIPLAAAADTRALIVPEAAAYGLGAARAVNVGNPHVVFEVIDAETAPVATAGPVIETAPLFPDRVNVGFAQVVSPEEVRLRVWERGAGLTTACGTGACAAFAVLSRAGLLGDHATMHLDGGDILIAFTREGRILMTGDVAHDGDMRITAQGLE